MTTYKNTCYYCDQETDFEGDFCTVCDREECGGFRKNGWALTMDPNEGYHLSHKYDETNTTHWLLSFVGGAWMLSMWNEYSDGRVSGNGAIEVGRPFAEDRIKHWKNLREWA